MDVRIEELNSAIEKLNYDNDCKTLGLVLSYQEDYDLSKEALIKHLTNQRNKFQKEFYKL